MCNERDIKYKAFIAQDIATNRGRLINCCQELKFLLDNPEVNDVFHEHYLQAALTHATTNSRYYQNCRNFKTLEDFPILTKQDLKANWDEILVPNYYHLPDNCTKFTSGSTGTPFKMVMDKYKHSRWIAGNKVFRDNVGVKSHEKTVFISETVADKNIPHERMDRDNVYYIDCRYFDDDSLNSLIGYLYENKVRTLTSLASLLDKIASYIRRGKAPKWDGDFIAIFSVSESLKESTRKTISEYFNCPVYVLYANEENGVLGVEDGSGYGCHVNNVDFHFEVLDLNEDKPVKDGEPGRLIITDFFNKAFPIIRYENGDIVSKKTMPNGRTYFTEIVGRKTDILYTSDGKLVHYFNGISFLEPLVDINQFQLIQNDYHHFKWILNTPNHTYEEYIISQCKELFGMDTHYEFEYVNEIPKLRSGKFRMTVCNIKDKDNKSAIGN